jgi:membrane-associated protease RseP (regulator of RpoE activity)
VLAALGYSDVAVHGRLREKTRQSAALLLLYSGMLLLLIWGTQHYNGGLLLPALFAPLGHEAIIQYGKWQAKQGKGGLLAPEWGVLILDVQHGSPAARAGLRSEDWILQLNGQPVENRQQFLQQQYFLPPHVQVDYMRRGKHKQCRMRMGHWNQPGIITAPDAQCNVYWMLGTDEGFIKVLYKFLSKKLVKTLKKK